MSGFISLCSLWNDVIMVGEMTVVSIMHKVRVCGRHLCKSFHPIDGSEINENAHFKVVSSGKFLPDQTKEMSVTNNRRRVRCFTHFPVVVSQTPILFCSQDTHCCHFKGQLMHRKDEKKTFNCVPV